jgi:flagellar protein FlaI
LLLEKLFDRPRREQRRDMLAWKRLGSGYSCQAPLLSASEEKAAGEALSLVRETGKPLEECIAELADAVVQDKIVEVLESETRGLSILDYFLADEDIEEIAILGTAPIRVYHSRLGWLDSDAAFRDEQALIDVCNRAARLSGRRLTTAAPVLSATLADGSRLHATARPAAECMTVTIRKFRARPFSPGELVASGTMTAEQAALLWLAIDAGMNILIAGTTGSGKTSTLNSLLLFVPLHERIVSVEETPEVRLPHRHFARLVAGRQPMQSLVHETLRMRPDRVIVGEARSPGEVRALLDVCLSGQGKGAFATFHAKTAKHTTARLESMGVARHELDAIDIVAVQKRLPGARVDTRKLVELAGHDGLPANKSGSATLNEIEERLGVRIGAEIKSRAAFVKAASRDWREAAAQFAAFQDGGK